MATQTRIDIRVDLEKKNVIARAAELSGQTITQYVLGLVWPDAERRTTQDNRLRLSQADWEAFTDRLDAPPRELPEVKALLTRKTRFQDA
ncbi:MAG: DUF1778 domain-containing protein [Verrucomicrobiaceae bacterium]|nr:DUF1778 domain-containing protein [Verrucomicrobiaceae bacterium]